MGRREQRKRRQKRQERRALKAASYTIRDKLFAPSPQNLGEKSEDELIIELREMKRWSQPQSMIAEPK